jgi:hypothetical protein
MEHVGNEKSCSNTRLRLHSQVLCPAQVQNKIWIDHSLSIPEEL